MLSDMHFIEEQFPPHPQCHQAVCAACHCPHTGEKVVNTGIEADLGEDGFYAYVYLGESCVKEWGRDLGQLDESQAEALREELADTAAELASLRERLAAFSQLDELIQKHASSLSAPADTPAPRPRAKTTK